MLLLSSDVEDVSIKPTTLSGRLFHSDASFMVKVRSNDNVLVRLLSTACCCITEFRRVEMDGKRLG